jgi:glycosyltransferase involved in cell wall biosynthesis
VKVLMIAPQPFFEPRGTPISVLQRLQGLSRLGHQVDLATYPVGSDVSLPGLKICRTLPIPFIRQVSIGPSWRKVILDAALFAKVVGMLLAKRYDVIHSHEEGAFLALILAPIFGVPHLYDMHSSLPRQLANFRFLTVRPVIGLFKFLEARVLKSCQVVVTIGADLEEHVLAVHGAANHIRIENTLLDDQPQQSGRDAEAVEAALGIAGCVPVVYTGTFERYQGLDLLLHSAQRVVAEYGDVVFVLVGGTPAQIAYWQSEARRLSLEGHVRFTGRVSVEAARDYVALAAILASPRTGGLSVPLKLYAYLQSGKPLVATRIAAHTQLLNDQIAILAEATPEAYADGLLRLLRDPELRARIGENARNYALQAFSPEQYLAKLKRAYLSIERARPIREIAEFQHET